MLNEVGVVAVVVAALAAGASPAAAQAGAASHGRLTPAAASALAPDPDGTADVTVPGERPSHAEIEARIGWLVQTYIMDAQAALHRDRLDDAEQTLARARSALARLEQRSAGHAQDRAVSTTVAASLARGAAALSAGDRAAAERALVDGERSLHASLVDLDRVLLPQSGPIVY